MAYSSLTSRESKSLQSDLMGAFLPVIPLPSDGDSWSSSASTVIPLPHSNRNPSNGAISNLSAPPAIPSSEALYKRFEEFSGAKGKQEATLLALMLRNDISLKNFKDIALSHSSFSDTAYSKIAPQFNMNPEYCEKDWKSVTVPRVSLPPSVRIALLQDSKIAFTTLGPPHEQENETARSCFISKWLESITLLFRGRLNDSVTSMPPTNDSPGSRTKHEISVSQRTPVLIIKVKFELSQAHAYWNFLAQVMCELHSAFCMNRDNGLQEFPVSAVLTDSKHWEFISYDGTDFFKDESIVFTPIQFSNSLQYSVKMLEVCSRIFGLLLGGYVNTSKAYAEKSRRRSEIGDESKAGSDQPLPIPEVTTRAPSITRKSTSVWGMAVDDAVLCQIRFEEAYRMCPSREGDEMAAAALEQLERSVKIFGGDNGFDLLDESLGVLIAQLESGQFSKANV